MAENCTRAFGRYLKTLRERRGLSLYDVCSLSQTFPDPLNKGYLSRCENGHQKLAFSKLIPLSRIYEVAPSVLVERMELDMELDRVGAPDTNLESYEDTATTARAALEEGRLWKAYGLFRDAVSSARLRPVLPRYKDLVEQVRVAEMNCATAAKSLGRIQFALHEYLYLDNSGELSSDYHPVILLTISGCQRSLNNLGLAEEYADRAITETESHQVTQFLGDAYCTRALLAAQQSEPELATTYYTKAYQAFKEVGRDSECARTLHNLADCYLRIKRYRAAREASQASQRLADALSLPRGRALSDIVLAEIEVLEKRPQEASRHLQEAVHIAKELNDQELRFTAELARFKLALRQERAASARAIERRLERLAPWMPHSTGEVDDFRRLASEHATFLGKSVS